MMSKKAAIVLARLDSQRFPQKALHEIHGKALLEWCISWILNNEFEVIIATTDRDLDNPIEVLAKRNGIKCFRGDTHNVAKRVLNCVEEFNIDYFARVNGDCPFVITSLLEKAFEEIEDSDFDFVTNLVPREFPYGISVEVFNAKVYKETYKHFVFENYKEHVTSYFYENISNFNPYYIRYNNGNDHYIRLVVDNFADSLVIEKILSQITDFNNLKICDLVDIYKKNILND
ncbi:MAG: cytidylyltransferase domain-containing protein [Bacteroidota bacterium]